MSHIPPNCREELSAIRSSRSRLRRFVAAKTLAVNLASILSIASGAFIISLASFALVYVSCYVISTFCFDYSNINTEISYFYYNRIVVFAIITFFIFILISSLGIPEHIRSVLDYVYTFGGAISLVISVLSLAPINSVNTQTVQKEYEQVYDDYWFHLFQLEANVCNDRVGNPEVCQNIAKHRDYSMEGCNDKVLSWMDTINDDYRSTNIHFDKLLQNAGISPNDTRSYFLKTSSSVQNLCNILNSSNPNSIYNKIASNLFIRVVFYMMTFVFLCGKISLTFARIDYLSFDTRRKRYRHALQRLRNLGS